MQSGALFLRRLAAETVWVWARAEEVPAGAATY